MNKITDTDPKSIRIDKINDSAGTQIRARIDTDTIDEYATAMQDGAKFPPVVLFQHGDDCILADGFHRFKAAKRNGFRDILAVVHSGDKSQALAYALSANTKHGLRLTISDKKRSVELALQQWPDRSSREIAKICNVSHPFVEKQRPEPTGNVTSSTPRTGADGKHRKPPERKRPEPERAEEPERPQVRTADEILTEQAQADQEKPTEAEPKQQNNYRAGMLRSLDICIATVKEVRKLKLSDDPDVIKKLKELRMMAGAALYKQGGKA